MSGFVTGLDNTSILISSTRSIIGPSNTVIIPDCVVEETGKDDLQITEHPVEIGSPISDHAFKKPREVTLRWDWTNSGNNGGRSETYVQEVYNVLLSLQASLQLFVLYIGKCSYQNMLMLSLTQTTNTTSEYSLTIVAICKEVIIVSTSSATLPTQSAQAPQSAQKNPSSTSPKTSSGACSLTSQSPGFGSNITSQTAFTQSTQAVP